MKKWLGYLNFITCILTICTLLGCTMPFHKPDFDARTGRFPTYANAQKKDIRIYKLLPGVQDVSFVCLQSATSTDEKAFEIFMQQSLKEIGFKSFASRSDLAKFVVQNGLSDQIPSVTDLVSLYKLNRALGPFLIANTTLYGDYGSWLKFEFTLLDPETSQTVLEISRFSNWILDFNKEICYPVMNVIKTWYDESSKLQKHDSVKDKKEEV